MTSAERIDKINKLLALASSTDSEEARTAAYTAVKLARIGGLRLAVDKTAIYEKVYSHNRGLLSFVCGFCGEPMVAEFEGDKQVTDWVCTGCRATGLQFQAAKKARDEKAAEQRRQHEAMMRRVTFWTIFAIIPPVIFILWNIVKAGGTP